MALIYNPLDKRVSVQVVGSWFDFGPGQVKLIHNDNVAHLMVTNKAGEGLVAVPDVVLEQPGSEEAKAAKAEARKIGVKNRISHLKGIIYNLEVSLQKDLDMKNLKTDPTVFASDGELSAYRELATYKKDIQSAENARAEEIKQLKEAAKDVE